MLLSINSNTSRDIITRSNTSRNIINTSRDAWTHRERELERVMEALARMFGAKKGEPPTPQMAIQRLRETEEMLNKKSEFLEKKIDQETALIKKHGMKNKRGVRRSKSLHVHMNYLTLYCPSSWQGSIEVVQLVMGWVCLVFYYGKGKNLVSQRSDCYKHMSRIVLMDIFIENNEL